jgi:pSer/pThr/pTyr-binding forkhead associated (FHA) protein
MDMPSDPPDGLPLPYPERQPDPTAPPPVPADFVPLRLVLLPSKLAVEFKRPETLVGRHSSADVRLPLPDVSRRHCRFVYHAGTWQVFDLASLNGIFVNGVKVTQATLHNRDVIDIGGFRFVVEINEHVAQGRHDLRATEGVIESIAEALPRPILDFGEPHRKAS